MRSHSRNYSFRLRLQPLTAAVASAVLLGLIAPASAACYWNREGEFCEPDTGPAQAPFFGARRSVHRQGNAGLAVTYRTICVRSCDGYFFPISYATGRGRFKTDAAVCQSMYPPGEASLYVYPTAGEDATQAVSATTGRPLASESFAFAYRSTYEKSCADLLRPGTAAPLISLNKGLSPGSAVAAVAPVPLPPHDQTPWPASADASATGASAEASAIDASSQMEGHEDRPIRFVGPVYDEQLPASREAEPAKVAQSQALRPRTLRSNEPAVTASILPNPLALLGKRKSMAPSEPPPEPAE